MSRNRHSLTETEKFEDVNIWKNILKNFEHFEKLQGREDSFNLEIKEAQEKMGIETNYFSVKALRDAYQEAVNVVNEQQSLLLQIQENLDTLIAHRQSEEAGKASEDFKIKKRRIEENSSDTIISRVKKSRSQTINSDILQVGSQVAFRQPKTKNSQGDWIQCIVTRVIGEGSKVKYEVQDPEPDENHHPGQIYKTVASNLILIPNSSVGLRPLSPGTQVLARYPETTTFYNAEVISTKKRDGTCKLRFEGEVEKETEVERKLVLELT
ncbi:hypothetical protein T552_01343 [Pneumocystis carinii B80]|uniref:SGF29 C-terminal domain-containing protein n=1 Tax=Pneumocystis carinii (strain B80) TaxID=1408658 RepID=A0A0W4ZLZ0_PNEC8|nr:hypothetical protein T552_01343 [Pneumocystis carinii B80]KTW29390.1 hypothetical protein T552_01343 [Pneumocystis carinii B80]